MAQKYSEMKLMENVEAGELNAESDTSKEPPHGRKMIMNHESS